MTMNICFATDDKYAKPTAIAMMTVMLTNKDEEIHFYILSQSLLDENKRTLENTVKKYSSKSKVEFCFLTNDILSQFFSTLKKSDHVSLATYFRIYIPSLLPKNVDKILYLDGDIICAENFSSFYKSDLTEYSMAASHDTRTSDPENFERLQYPNKNGYAAAGVLLINVAWWRKNNIQQKCLDFISENKAICKWHDQDALNKVLNGTIKFCPIKYNAYELIFEGENKYPDFLLDEVTEAQKNPVFIHFCSGRKPWNKESRCPFSSTWLKLYKQLFEKNCHLTHRYKGKIKILWNIKRIINMLRIKKYEEFNPHHEHDALKLKIEKQLMEKKI